MKLREKFRQNPSLFYALSICATWAGAGSFIVGTQIAQNVGILPWVLWALGNTSTCIVFGLLANKFPKLRQVANSKPVQILMGIMCIFQVWVNMNGVYESLSVTAIGSTAARIIVYAIAAFFIVFYLVRATPRNVLTDTASWLTVMVLIVVLIAVSIMSNGVHSIPLGLDPAELKAKGWLLFTLMFGGFFYPTFWELLDYNESNEDGTSKVDIKKCFIAGGCLFGFYLLFVLLGSLTQYSGAMLLIKGILISLVAVSSLSSFIYGTMINLGKKIGVAVNLVTVGLWQVLVPMGVMGVWTLMQNVRIWMVLGMFAIALIVNAVEKKKNAGY